jgi:phosphate transport system protein
MSPYRSTLEQRVAAIERDLLTMCELAVQRLRAALSAWEAGDTGAAARVIADDDLVDDLCLRMEGRVFTTQLREAPVARDQRLLHVARVVGVALERVGDLASGVAELTLTTPWHPDPPPRPHARLERMGELAIGSLAQCRAALAEGDVLLASGVEAMAADARVALRDLVREVSEGSRSGGDAAWSAAAVLLGRLLERVADNAAAIAVRIDFLVNGPPPRPALRP